MKSSPQARVALALLGYLAPRNEPLAGDLLEEFQARRSVLWLWCQIAVAVIAGSFRDRRGPTALNLTPIDPIVAEWLMSKKLRPRQVTLSSPIEGVGGLALMMLGLLLSTVVPDVWWFVIAGIACGIALGSTLAFRRRHHPIKTSGSYFTNTVLMLVNSRMP